MTWTEHQRFYGDVLGWQVSRFDEQPYWPVRAGDDEERGANGALVGRGELHRSPIVTISVEDIDDALSRVVRSGDQVSEGKLPIPGVGWSAYMVDSEGNTIGLFQPEGAAP